MDDNINPTEPLDLDPIEARVNAATAGPWKALEARGEHWYAISANEAVAWISSNDGSNESQREPDAQFIAHAREDVPALLAEVKRLRSIVAETTEREQQHIDYAQYCSRRAHQAEQRFAAVVRQAEYYASLPENEHDYRNGKRMAGIVVLDALKRHDIVAALGAPVGDEEHTPSANELRAQGVGYAEEYLVRKDQFSGRTLELLTDLAELVRAGEFVSDMPVVPDTRNEQ